MVKKISLSGKNGIGKFALIDDEDYDFLKQFKWQFKIGRGKMTGYAARTSYIRGVDGKYKNKTILMHKEIMNSFSHDIDHIDGNGLNNQRLNLRLASASQNAMNRSKKRTSKNKYKGVHWHSRDKCWLAIVGSGKERIEFRGFSSEIDAAMAYDKEALKRYGEFARINFKEVSHR